MCIIYSKQLYVVINMGHTVDVWSNLRKVSAHCKICSCIDVVINYSLLVAKAVPIKNLP